MTDHPTGMLAERLSAAERDVARDERLARALRDADPPLVKFARVWGSASQRDRP